MHQYYVAVLPEGYRPGGTPELVLSFFILAVSILTKLRT